MQAEYNPGILTFVYGFIWALEDTIKALPYIIVGAMALFAACIVVLFIAGFIKGLVGRSERHGRKS